MKSVRSQHSHRAAIIDRITFFEGQIAKLNASSSCFRSGVSLALFFATDDASMSLFVSCGATAALLRVIVVESLFGRSYSFVYFLFVRLCRRGVTSFHLHS